MIDLIKTQTTPTSGKTFALAVGAAIIVGQFQYPEPVEAHPEPVETYKVQQVSGTYSAFNKPLQTAHRPSQEFVRSMASIYSSIVGRQEPLGTEYEAAIFDDIEELYEA